jgi:hypothetical protein
MNVKESVIKTLANGIQVEYNETENTTTLWSPDGDYDAVYRSTDFAGIESEIKFITHLLTLGVW